jgi:hypothetical protein
MNSKHQNNNLKDEIDVEIMVSKNSKTLHKTRD